MKNLNIIVSVAIVFSVACSKTEKPEANKTLIKEVKATLTPLKFGKESPGDNFLWATENYDRLGNMTSKTETYGLDDLDGDRSYRETTTYKYEGNKLIEKQDDIYRYTYKYNGKDTTEISKYGSTGLSETRKYTYADGRVSKVEIFNAGGSTLRVDVYEYKNGMVSAINHIYDESEPANQTRYERDSKGNAIARVYFNASKNTTRTEAKLSYKYDEKGRIIEFTRSWGPISERKFYIEYDEKGRVISKRIFESDFEGKPFEQKATVNYSYEYQ